MNPGRGMQEQEPDQANSQLKLYLAQRDVAEVLPEVAANVPDAPPFPGLAERLHQRSVWLGCAGTLTPLHHDPYHNLFCQASSLLLQVRTAIATSALCTCSRVKRQNYVR